MINMDINELVELMVETIVVKQPVIRINKYDFPYDVVRSRLEKMRGRRTHLPLVLRRLLQA